MFLALKAACIAYSLFRVCWCEDKEIQGIGQTLKPTWWQRSPREAIDHQKCIWTSLDWLDPSPNSDQFLLTFQVFGFILSSLLYYNLILWMELGICLPLWAHQGQTIISSFVSGIIHWIMSLIPTSSGDTTVKWLCLHLHFSHGLVNTMSIMFACCNLLVHLALMVWTATYGV